MIKVILLLLLLVIRYINIMYCSSWCIKKDIVFYDFFFKICWNLVLLWENIRYIKVLRLGRIRKEWGIVKDWRLWKKI